MEINIIVDRKEYNWKLSLEKLKETIKQYNGIESENNFTEKQVKETFSIDPYTIGLIVTGVGLGLWTVYRFNREQFFKFKESIGIK